MLHEEKSANDESQIFTIIFSINNQQLSTWKKKFICWGVIYKVSKKWPPKEVLQGDGYKNPLFHVFFHRTLIGGLNGN